MTATVLAGIYMPTSGELLFDGHVVNEVEARDRNVGIVGLASNFNLLPPHIFRELWKLWPLIPLAIGVSILMGRRRSLDDRNPRDIDH